MSALFRILGQEGPETAGDTYRGLCERMALDACAGELPTAANRATLYAANDGIFGYSRAASQRREAQQLADAPSALQ